MVDMDNLQVSDSVEVTLPKKGRGQYERKARGSYQNEKKITIELFLNKRLKPEVVGNKKYYPLYLKISLKGQTTHFPFMPSAVEDYMGVESIDGSETIDLDAYENTIINKSNIQKVIEILRPFDRDDFKISEIALIFTSLMKPIHYVVYKVLGTFSKMFLENDENPFSGNKNTFFLQLAWNLSEKKTNTFNKIDPEFWYLEEYCNLISRKQVVKEWYRSQTYTLQEENDLTLLSYMKGNFQQRLIEEIGQEKSDKIFNSIDFVLETYFSNEIWNIKNILK